MEGSGLGDGAHSVGLGVLGHLPQFLPLSSPFRSTQERPELDKQWPKEEQPRWLCEMYHVGTISDEFV